MNFFNCGFSRNFFYWVVWPQIPFASHVLFYEVFIEFLCNFFEKNGDHFEPFPWFYGSTLFQLFDFYRGVLWIVKLFEEFWYVGLEFSWISGCPTFSLTNLDIFIMIIYFPSPLQSLKSSQQKPNIIGLTFSINYFWLKS
jgi:hypothetical protein